MADDGSQQPGGIEDKDVASLFNDGGSQESSENRLGQVGETINNNVPLIHKATDEDNKISAKEGIKVAKVAGEALLTDNPEPLIEAAIEDPDLARRVLVQGISPAGKKTLDTVEKIPVIGKAVDTVDLRHWRIGKGDSKRRNVNDPIDDAPGVQNKLAGDAEPVQGKPNLFRQAQNPNIKANPSGGGFNGLLGGSKEKGFNGLLGNKKDGTEGDKKKKQPSPQDEAKKKAEAAAEKAAIEAASAIFAPAGVALAGLFWARKHKDAIRKGFIAILTLIFFVVFSLIGHTSQTQYGNPAGGIASTNPYGGQASCSQMQDHLDIPGSDGQAIHLTLSGTAGGYSKEEDGVGLGLDAYSKSIPGFDADWLKYYITARWMYSASPFGTWGVTAKDPNYHPMLPSETMKVFNTTLTPRDYAGRKIIIYNPSTKKGVVGVALEYGPRPWTGISDADKDTQKTLWEGDGARKGADGLTYRIEDPPGFKGRVAGGGDAVTAALGITSYSGKEQIIYGFAIDQTLKPGTPIECQTVEGTGTATGKFIVNTPTKVLLNSPGAAQGLDKNCNVAALVSMLLYYNRSYQENDLFTNNPGDGSVATAKSSCAEPIAHLNKVSKVSDWVRVNNAKSSSQENFVATVKDSLKDGHPVMYYGLACSIFCSSQHVITIVGFDDETKTFYVNSSSSADAAPDVRTNKIGDKLLTYDHMWKYLDNAGGAGNETSLIIRKTYADKYGLK